MREERLENYVDEVAKGEWGIVALPFQGVQQDKLHTDYINTDT